MQLDLPVRDVIGTHIQQGPADLFSALLRTGRRNVGHLQKACYPFVSVLYLSTLHPPEA